MFPPTTRYGRSVLVVLVCLSAGIIEGGLFVYAINGNQWNGLYYQANWNLALAVNREGILASANAIVSGVVCARHSSTLLICEIRDRGRFLGMRVTFMNQPDSHVFCVDI